jgi:hypothetical protein
MATPCTECGAVYTDPARSCAERFDTLLALDHSREEPWGSRHGLIFAAYQLQHSTLLEPAAIDRYWLILYRIYVHGDDPVRMFAALRGRPDIRTHDWDVPSAKRPPAAVRYAVTIADLGDFEAAGYPSAVDRWCRAVLAAWGAPVAAP